MSQIEIQKPTATLWRARFNNPPINLMGGQMVVELRGLIEAAEKDPDVAVILFESANPDFFIAHWDLADSGEALAGLPKGPTGQSPLSDVFIRLSKLPVLTISAIRGRARGAGSELALATDIRFASDKAILGQFEMSTGVMPGGGSPSRLPRLVGRGRALEILVGGEDFPGQLAERYGYVNRAIADADFEAFIDAFASRVSGFNRQAIQELKQVVDPITLPPNEEFPPQLASFQAGVRTPEIQARVRRLFERGLQKPGDLEERLGELAPKV